MGCKGVKYSRRIKSGETFSVKLEMETIYVSYGKTGIAVVSRVKGGGPMMVFDLGNPEICTDWIKDVPVAVEVANRLSEGLFQ